MFQIKKILFPVDFSERGLGASRYVEDMAGRFQADVSFLHVVGKREDVFFAPEFGGTAMMEQFEHKVLNAKRAMKSYLEEEFEQFNISREVLEGDPATEIVSYAQRHGVDLIMMPSHGYGVFRRYVIGSVTAKVLHDAACPVWTGAHLEHSPLLEEIRFDRVLCAVDLGPESGKALEWAHAFAREHGAQLTVVHAVAWQPLADAAREKLEELLSVQGIAARVVVEEGEPAKVASELASRDRSQLLVIARGSAAGGLGRLRAHAYALIRSSPCPVVSV